MKLDRKIYLNNTSSNDKQNKKSTHSFKGNILNIPRRQPQYQCCNFFINIINFFTNLFYYHSITSPQEDEYTNIKENSPLLLSNENNIYDNDEQMETNGNIFIPYIEESYNEISKYNPNSSYNGKILSINGKMCKVWQNSNVKKIYQSIDDNEKVFISGNCPNLTQIVISNAKIENANLPNLSVICASSGYYGLDEISAYLDIENSTINNIQNNLKLLGALDSNRSVTPNRKLNIRTHKSFINGNILYKKNVNVIANGHYQEDYSYNVPLNVKDIKTL